MSHFPGTDRYANPELGWDRRVLEKLAAGNLKALIGFDEAELDDTGNIELRCWGMAAGALGDRKPDVMVMNPSWHHNYASLGWWTPPADEPTPHYPNIRPELVQVTAALHAIAHDPAAREAYHANPEAFADRYKITAEQRTALIKMDFPAFVAMGAHPLTPFLANMHVERMRKAGR
jgi:2,3-dihydroxyphenylpropionate 1,2-dioxygenase